MTPRLGLRASHERTLEALYQRHAAEVYRYALMMLDSPADAEDVTQTTFLNAYRALLRGERPRSTGSWLRAIAHNLCLQHFRQASRRPRQVELEDEAADLVSEDQGLLVDDLSRALRQIPVNQRAALLMRELEGRPIAEIAEILDVSTSAVETLLFRARRGVREQLEGGLTCAEAEEAISRQLDGQLKRRERGALRAHLRECEECSHLARSLRAQRGAIKSLGVIPLPAALAWSKFSAGAAAGGVANAGAAATGGAWIVGSSLAAKLGGATLLAAVAGAGYVAAADHPWTANGRVATVPVRVAAAAGHGASSASPAPAASAASTPVTPGGPRRAVLARANAHAKGAGATASPAPTPPAALAPGRGGAAPSGRAGKVTPARASHHAHSARPKRIARPPKRAHRTKPAHPAKPTHPAHPKLPTTLVPIPGSAAPKESHSQPGIATATLLSTWP